jgi:hypothetical protein
VASPQQEVDTRTYFHLGGFEGEVLFCSRCGSDCTCLTADGPAPSVPRAVMTRDVVIGHEGFPCPSTRGEGTCAEAWDNWRKHAGIELLRA